MILIGLFQFGIFYDSTIFSVALLLFSSPLLREESRHTLTSNVKMLMSIRLQYHS